MGYPQHSATRRPVRRRPTRDLPAGSHGAPGCRSRYGGRWFLAASALPLDPGLGRPDRLARLLAVAVRRPRRLLALIVLLLSTRSEEVVLSRSSTGRALREYFDQRFLAVFPQNQLCRAVLVLPRDHADYLRGRRRQAVRTNLRRAAAAGIRCRSKVRPACALKAARVILERRRAPSTDADRASLTRVWPALFARPEVTITVASDDRGEPLALMAAVIDDSVCVIHLAVASSHEARWALHDHLVRLLIARGVRYLLSEGGGPFGALGFAPEVHHYQRLLGYELRHLVPRVR